jgi:hypothetical protein
MRRASPPLAPLTFLVLLLAWAPGCVTIGMWDAASGAGDDRAAKRVQRARLMGETLELIVDFEDEGPHLVKVELGAATRGFYDGKPTLRGEVLGYREQDLEPVHLEVKEDGLLGEADGPEPSAAPAGAPNPEPPPAVPPRLYWYSNPEAENSLILCLRRTGLDPLYIEVQGLGGSAAAPFAYLGAGLLTPVTFAVDVVTFPFQVVMIFVFASAIDDIFN